MGYIYQVGALSKYKNLNQVGQSVAQFNSGSN